MKQVLRTALASGFITILILEVRLYLEHKFKHLRDSTFIYGIINALLAFTVSFLIYTVLYYFIEND